MRLSIVLVAPLLVFGIGVDATPAHHLQRAGDEDIANTTTAVVATDDRSLTFIKKFKICRRRRNDPSSFFTKKVFQMKPGDLKGECKENCKKLCPDSFCDIENNQCISLCPGIVCSPEEQCECSCQDPSTMRSLTWKRRKKVKMCEVRNGIFKTIKVKNSKVKQLQKQGVLKGPCENHCDTLCPSDDQFCDVMGSGQCIQRAPPAQCSGASVCPGHKTCSCVCKNSSTPTCPTKSYSVSTSLDYDKLVLPAFGESQVTWDVAYASRETKLDFILPYDGSEHELVLEELLASIEALELDTSSLTESTLALPDVPAALSPSCQSDASVHITIPRYARELCIGSMCRPVLCPVGPFHSLSYIPGNNEMFFGQSTTCDIMVPAFWNEFVETYFGETDATSSILATPNSLGRMDIDADGASNIVEYYGLPLISLYADQSPVASGTGLSQEAEAPLSTDPYKPDTDGDLFVDGYELLYGLDPFTQNGVSDDTDGDSLIDFDEQIYGTNPLNDDSDNDGVDDATEILDGTDPLDGTDFIPKGERRLAGANCDDKKTVSLSLSIGDHSGSHSERYILTVGSVAHQATQFGVVRTASYPFLPGTYKITVQHLDTKRSQGPDYDYTAAINWTASTDFEITINDPQRLLGRHDESTYDFAAGKSASITIKELDPKCSYSTCAECRADSECRWKVHAKVCFRYCRRPNFPKQRRQRHYRELPPSSCPCEKCKAWAKKERKDLKWINTLPRCPCVVTITSTLGTKWLNVPNPAEGVDWNNDLNCNPFTDCSNAHPGAYGCIRADASTGNAGQQCCYSNKGGQIKYIPTGEGAGTPDKATGVVGHLKEDYWTYKNCCSNCEIKEICSEYIGGEDVDGQDVVGVRQDTRGCL